MIGWCSKYVHIIADTFILLGALKAKKRSIRGEQVPEKGKLSV